MFYNEEFIIKDNMWNNSFSYKERKTNWKAEITVAKLVEWNTNDLKVWKNIAFEEKDFNWKIKWYYWLENFIKIKNWDKKIYIFDNHNHALYFWYLEQIKWNIDKKSKLIHIDQHSDMENWKEFNYDKLNKENIWKYTNYDLNVWNYIIPAKKLWIVDEIVQVRSNYKLKELKNIKINKSNTILNIDIDFWAPEMISDNDSILIAKNLIKKSEVITIATSPYFIDQKLAINIVKKILT